MSTSDKAQLRNAKEKVLRRLARRLKTNGFLRTKPTFYVRPRGLVIEFVHLHKYTFNASFRPHLGLRVINDPHTAVTLNGPSSDAYGGPNSPTGKPQDFSFDPSEDAINRCAESLADFVQSYAEPWFALWHDQALLVESEDSPLRPVVRAALARAIAGECEAPLVAQTRALLNVT